MKLPTGSALDRVIACPPSWLLTQVDRENEDADRGTTKHRFLQLLVESGREEALKFSSTIEDPELRKVCEAMEVEFYEEDGSETQAEPQGGEG